MIGIYKITNPKGKIYIGQSVNIEKRFRQYKSLSCKNQRILYRSFLKYGIDKHKFEIICCCSKNELNNYERFYQDLFCTVGKNGLNCSLTDTETQRYEHSKETIEKIRKSKTGQKHSRETKAKMSLIHQNQSTETRKKISESMKGLIKSEITRIKLSEANKGKILSDDTRNKIRTARKKQIITPEMYAKGALKRIGKKRSTETRSKMSEIAKNMTSEHRFNLSKSMKGNTNGNKIVLDCETGIYYNSVKEASFIFKINLGYFRSMLNGSCKNKTNCIYV